MILRSTAPASRCSLGNLDHALASSATDLLSCHTDSSIVISNVSVVFGDGANAVKALDQVSLEVGQNEFFTLLGPSGCGKTTLLRCIAGFEIPTRGSILLDGVALEGLPPFKRPVNTVF